MAAKAKIMIVSNEPEAARIWGFTLVQAGLELKQTDASYDVTETWTNEPQDLVVIEEFHEKGGMLDLCRQFRVMTSVPILYLTTKTTENYLLDIYRAGADEVIPLPISPVLFQAKVKAWLRQIKNIPANMLDVVEIGGFLLNPETRQLKSPSGSTTELSVLESRLLYLIMRHPKRVFTQNQLIDRVWGSFDEGDGNMLKNLIYRVRRKIEPDPAQPRYLVTEGSFGYKFQI